MSLLDLLVLLFVISAVYSGHRAGFVSRAAGWAGLIVGITVAVLLLPLVVSITDSLDDAWVLLAALVLLVAAAASGQVLGLHVGERLRGSLPVRAGPTDRIVGAVAGGLAVIVMFWLLLPSLAAVPGWTSEQVAGSFVAGRLEAALPEPPDTLSALRDAVGDESFPTVFDETASLVDPGPAPLSVVLDPDVNERVRASIVRVQTQACGRTQQGTGFVQAPGLVVTNAHVVAGASSAKVITADGTVVTGTVVAFDAARDLAAVRFVDLDLAPLNTVAPEPGQLSAAFGHPGGGELRVAPARVADVLRASGRDLYDEVDTVREVLVLAVNLRLGDSGAPIVDQRGSVIGVAFAVAPDGEDTAYALTTDEVASFLAASDTNQPLPASACVG